MNKDKNYENNPNVTGRIGEGQSTSDKFRNYDMNIVRPGSEPINVDNETVDVHLRTLTGQEYSANFVTRGFLDWVFKKNEGTGECASGRYFAMPGMVVVQRVDEDAVRKTIDDMIRNKDIENYFYELN